MPRPPARTDDPPSVVAARQLAEEARHRAGTGPAAAPPARGRGPDRPPRPPRRRARSRPGRGARLQDLATGPVTS
jgi:hypothetical protein